MGSGLSGSYHSGECMSEEFELYKKKIDKKRKLIKKHNLELNKLLDECTHEEIEPKSYYYSGSYYDRSYVELWNQCRVCGKCSEKSRDENHQGSYG